MAHTIPRFIHHPHSPLSVLLPPPTTTPSLFSNHHHHTPQGHCAHPLPTLLPHTHMVWMACAFVAALTSCVWCVWMACTSHHIVHTHSHNHCGFAHRHTTTLWCVCAWKHVPHGHAQPPTTHLHGVVFSLSSQVRAIKPFAIHPVCVCGGLVVGLCWCGHLCECLCVGWLCCFPPHCVSCVPPCPHPSVSPHSLALVLLLVMVVIGGG